ncbi:MAG: GNAT family N-acetyltransferase [Rhodospirillaceae bacterium]
MITYLLGDEEVKAYSNDLIARLGFGCPDVWVVLGQSGQSMADLLVEFTTDEFKAKLRVMRVSYDRTTRVVSCEDTLDNIKLDTESVLVVDSAVHSGGSMLAVCEYLAGLGAKRVMSYSLVLKKGSYFVPSLFGVLIGDEDRAFFDLDKLPNNRLMNPASFGYIRPIRQDDVKLPLLKVGVASVERDFGELYLESTASQSTVYLYILNNVVCGFICFNIDSERIYINSFASATESRGKGIGVALLRWAETLARSRCCKIVELWAIKDKISFYTERGYHSVEGKTVLYDSETIYQFMQRKLLYNTKEYAMNNL